MRTRIGRLGLAVLLAAVAASASAQDAPAGPAPATLAYIEGGVDLDHEGRVDAATAPILLLDGDRVRTREGRAEIVFADGSLLHADRDTVVEWLGPGHLRLLAGRALIRLSASAASYTIDTPPSSVRLEPRGEYDLGLTSRGSEIELAVARGVAQLEGSGERVLVRGGEALVTDGSGRAALRRFNSARFDAFSRWAYDRATGTALGGSSQYLPAELRAYGSSLDRYGYWDYAPSYGYVWYPSAGVGWRPYSHGGWRHTRYGWTWYGLDPWAWPTHHFGRWGFSGSAWFWVPGKVWGPAWVNWAFAPGYVGWSPLGWDHHHGAQAWRGARRGGYDGWQSWTAIPRRHFGQRGPVQSWIVDARTLPEASRRAFVFQSNPPRSPASRGYAVPRGSLSVAGSQSPRPTPVPAAQDVQPGAVPRATAPQASSIPAGSARSPNSWSPSRTAPGGVVRRPPDSPVPSPPVSGSTTPVMRDTAPRMRDTAPIMRDTAPTTIPAPGNSRGDTQYAIPRRSPDGRYRSEDADVFRGGARAPRSSPPSETESRTPRERPRGSDSSMRPPSSSEGGGRSGAVRDPGRAGRTREGGEGRSAAPPPRSQPQNSGRNRDGGNGSGNSSRGAVRRPPR